MKIADVQHHNALRRELVYLLFSFQRGIVQWLLQIVHLCIPNVLRLGPSRACLSAVFIQTRNSSVIASNRAFMYSIPNALRLGPSWACSLYAIFIQTPKNQWSFKCTMCNMHLCVPTVMIDLRNSVIIMHHGASHCHLFICYFLLFYIWLILYLNCFRLLWHRPGSSSVNYCCSWCCWYVVLFTFVPLFIYLVLLTSKPF